MLTRTVSCSSQFIVGFLWACAALSVFLASFVLQQRRIINAKDAELTSAAKAEKETEDVCDIQGGEVSERLNLQDLSEGLPAAISAD